MLCQCLYVQLYDIFSARFCGCLFLPAFILYMSTSNIIGMAVKNKGGGMVSTAGLVTYYDSEDKRSFHISPKVVLVFAAAVGIIVAVLNHIF